MVRAGRPPPPPSLSGEGGGGGPPGTVLRGCFMYGTHKPQAVGWRWKAWLGAALASALLAAGCETHAGTGMLAGGTLGALTGAAIGSATHHAGTGALIGATAGATLGGLTGAAVD